jgi:hypothetical protein
MILLFTQAFQLRLRLGWKADLTGFLIGERNHYFFTPETLVEVPEINLESIDKFLSRGSIGAPWQLLGFLAPNEIDAIPGYAQVKTSGDPNPAKWSAKVYLLQDSRFEPSVLQVKIAGQ